MKKKIREYDVFTGGIWNLGSKEKNIASARRKLRNKRYKGRFKIFLGKAPKSTNGFVRFKAIRRAR